MAGDERKPALGRPAPFTQEQVDALVRGKLDPDETARILEAHPTPRIKDVTQKTEKIAPVDVSLEDLRAIQEGQVSRSVLHRLEESAKLDNDQISKIDDKADRPKQEPPKPK